MDCVTLGGFSLLSGSTPSKKIFLSRKSEWILCGDGKNLMNVNYSPLAKGSKTESKKNSSAILPGVAKTGWAIQLARNTAKAAAEIESDSLCLKIVMAEDPIANRPGILRFFGFFGPKSYAVRAWQSAGNAAAFCPFVRCENAAQFSISCTTWPSCTNGIGRPVRSASSVCGSMPSR